MLEQVVAQSLAANPSIWQALPDDEREVLWLTCELGLSYDEAAKAAGMSVEAARACLLRARLQFMPIEE